MEDWNDRMAAMQAEFQKEREDLTARLRVQEAANQRMREEAKRKAVNRESQAKLERSRKEGRWAHPSPDKVMVMQLIVEELLFRLWAPC